MGNTCKPMVDSFQCMTKSTTRKKKGNKIKAPEKGIVKLKTPEAFPKKTKAPQSWV